jgi:glucose-1-phosphate cytidylyltransferase
MILFERQPLENLAENNQLAAYQHKGFWMPMDKLSDKVEWEKMWKQWGGTMEIWI